MKSLISARMSVLEDIKRHSESLASIVAYTGRTAQLNGVDPEELLGFALQNIGDMFFSLSTKKEEDSTACSCGDCG